ncbi:MAG: glycosyltransferase family 4 protein [Bacteroidetes bacterium]|nr:glycosyltransferase family 4 protein [Bacteroidota bacterium]
MKILYYSSHPQLSLYAQSGPGTHIREMINAFQELGHDVLPVIMGGDKPLQTNQKHISQKESGLKKAIKKIVPKKIWRTLKEYKLLQFDKAAEKLLHDKIVEFNPDIVYERGAYLQTSGLNVLKLFPHIKHVTEINAPYLEEMLQFEGVDTLLKKKAITAESRQIKESTLVSVVSTPLKKHYSQYTQTTDKIVVVPNAINEILINIDVVLQEKIRNQYRLSNKTVIGFVGSIFPYHGVDLLIESFAALLPKHPQIALLIVGDGQILPDLKKLTQSLHIEQHVHFTGSVKHTDVFSHINCMDITILAKTNYFCSPVKIFEYGVLEKAIVSISTSAIQDVLTHKKNAFLIPSASKNELTDAISYLLSNPEEARRLGRKVKQDILSNHTWIKNAQTILHLLEKHNS